LRCDDNYAKECGIHDLCFAWNCRRMDDQLVCATNDSIRAATVWSLSVFVVEFFYR
jgi:hypothetical protein